MTRDITLILPYYENGGMLREQHRCWAALSEKTRSRLHAIVVDDGSPEDPASAHAQNPGLASWRLFRAGVDVRWNWLFCRNLGVEHATTEWVVMTDIDHVLPEATWCRLMRGKLDPLNVYRLSRVDAPDLTPYKPHPNTWVMTRHMFRERIGGYDERFSGFYGTDGEFRDRVNAWARRVVMLPEVAIRYPREVIQDASTTRYGRKEEQDRTQVRAIRDARGTLGDWRPLRLTFPWAEVPVP